MGDAALTSWRVERSTSCSSTSTPRVHRSDALNSMPTGGRVPFEVAGEPLPSSGRRPPSGRRSIGGMIKLFQKWWRYLTASLTGKFNERADPKVQLEQAIMEAQDQHRRLVEQAANVIA